MLSNKTVVALLAGGLCLSASGCNSTHTTDLAGRSPAMAARGDALSSSALPGEDDLSVIPHTWYCVPSSPWSDDREQERQGMERFAWRLFIAINWPGRFDPKTSQWKPAPELAALNEPEIYPRWATWYAPKQLYEEFRDRGTPKSEFPKETGWACTDKCLKSALEGPGFSLKLSETAGHKQVYDQNGNCVLYEIRVDESVRDTLQEKVELNPSPREVQENQLISFQYGQCKGRGPERPGPDSFDFTGALAIKLAWKRLTEAEIASARFLQRRASPSNCDPKSQLSEVTFGLVGFNIAQKTFRYDDWTWFTFEHVDNLAPSESSRAPSFNDPSCDASTCCPNTSQTDPAAKLCKTQITRVTDIAPLTRQLNEKEQRELRARRTALQYYELIGAQYVPYKDRLNAKPALAPETLRNSVIETYLVGSNQLGCSRELCGPGPRSKASSCSGCHAEGARKHDFSFIPQNDLCNCSDKEHRWIGNDKCKRLGISCP
jgi:hypothetical protein